ncbi:hypothetical protein G6F40_016442 [Rhizopus arrhizus]|nr:hypothetical protein G6F40_016442 [Rhizopus arrhizus]
MIEHDEMQWPDTMRAAVGGAQHHFADRPALGLRLGQQRRQRHHVGVGHPATEEDAVALLVISLGHDVIRRREGADADQPGQGQAQLRMLHTFSLHPQHAGKGSNVRAARTPPADPLRIDECIHNENGVPHTLPHPVIVA